MSPWSSQTLPLREILTATIPDNHLEALQWYAEHAGEEVGFPDRLPDGTFLATRAKGIFKPAGWDYALSVRQVLNGPYDDREPQFRPDGTWSYLYYQEGEGTSDLERLFTNRALQRCAQDGVPVGVLIQTVPKPSPRYAVMGLAFVREWRLGYFLLEGMNVLHAAVHEHPRPYEAAAFVTPSADLLEWREQLFQHAVAEVRERKLALVSRRDGQGAFRAEILRNYGGKCAVTRTDAVDALEAAHILPYHGPATNVAANGLLLRADIHSLFDLGLMAIEPNRMELILAPGLLETTYAPLNGTSIALPARSAAQPDPGLLDMHRRLCGL